MQPTHTAALEAQAWRDFIARLADHLALRWPAMPERLGERYPAFVDLAVQQAQAHGLQRAASVARLVNLWFVWGPAFQDRAGFEWAPPLLARAPQQEWLAVHQLVQRSLAELQRLPGARIEPQALAAADASLLDAFGSLGRQGRLWPAEALPAPRQACDLAAADIRLLDDGWHQPYQLGAGGDWQRSAAALPPALRVDAQHPMPLVLAALAHPAGQGPEARLQVKLRPLQVCEGDTHPALGFAGPHGRWQWAGHAARAASWPLAPREQPLPRAGPGAVVAEETSPELYRLDLETCGLRDEGEALGPQRATVAVWPATQWWVELQRTPPPAQPLLPGPRAWQRGSTQCRVERDGQPLDASSLRQQFETGLDGATGQGLKALASAWQRLPGQASARLDAQLGLLTGQAGLSWGWAWCPVAGLDGPALMRLVGQLALEACQADLQLVAEWSPDPPGDGAADDSTISLHGLVPSAGPQATDPSVLAGTRTRLRLRLAGQASLQLPLRREAAKPPIAGVLAGAVARWRWPAELQVEPLAVASGRLVQAAGAVTGALVGEAGLRPCTTGTSGWEWFVGLRLEPVSVLLMVNDPLLGQQQQQLPLLPALTLVDWRLG